jgi:hypothetical protein
MWKAGDIIVPSDVKDAYQSVEDGYAEWYKPSDKESLATGSLGLSVAPPPVTKEELEPQPEEPQAEAPKQKGSPKSRKKKQEKPPVPAEPSSDKDGGHSE